MGDPLVALAILAWLAYLASRLLARHHLPELVGFLLVGVVLGPSAIGLLEAETLEAMQPVTEMALAVLMFIIGERVSMRALKAARWTVTAGLAQYVLSALFVYWAATAVGANRPVALVLAALAGAGAPMTIAHIVSTTRASGTYPAGVVSTHAVSDALATVTFAAVLPVAALLADQTTSTGAVVWDFIRLGIGGAVLGLALGWMVSKLGFQIETSGELLLFVLVHLLLGWVLADWLDISLPLAALLAGATAATAAPEGFTARLFRTIRTIEQPLYLLFFALAGAAIHLEDVPKVGAIGITYIGVRVVAKLVGGMGGLLGGLSWRLSLRLGVNLTPQAGVAVGLAVLASERLGDDGSTAATVVLGSVVLFELVGPFLVARDFATWRAADSDDPAALPANFGVPAKVLLAAPVEVTVPDWVLSDLSRWRARLVALLPCEDDDEAVANLRSRCVNHDVEFEFLPLRNESFVGTVVRAQAETEAEMVVLFSPRPRSTTSRLVLLPAERIARQLRVPVSIFPLSAVGVEDAAPRRRRLPWQT